MGVNLGKFDRVVALAGNPNTGKSTLFNALTGLKQHTGNWPGKTVTRAEGGFEFNKIRYKLVDLPGTYSLLSASSDEEIARDFLLFGRPDVTVVVIDATAIERNLNLVLQVLEITSRVVVAVNLMDEAARKGMEIDLRSPRAILVFRPWASWRAPAKDSRVFSRPSMESLRARSRLSRYGSRALRSSSARSRNSCRSSRRPRRVCRTRDGLPSGCSTGTRKSSPPSRADDSQNWSRVSKRMPSGSARRSRFREPSK
jgi:energy-coupling factor transporter ATP-binding protein EcfA2